MWACRVNICEDCFFGNSCRRLIQSHHRHWPHHHPFCCRQPLPRHHHHHQMRRFERRVHVQGIVAFCTCRALIRKTWSNGSNILLGGWRWGIKARQTSLQIRLKSPVLIIQINRSTQSSKDGIPGMASLLKLHLENNMQSFESKSKPLTNCPNHCKMGSLVACGWNNQFTYSTSYYGAVN